MAFDFKKSAQEVVLLSPIMVGKQKLKTEDIIGQDLTIIGFDFAPKFDNEGRPVVDDNGEVDTFGVVVFQEQPNMYYCVGTVFTKVCKVWLANFDSPEAASAELAASGGVRVRFTKSSTKKGNNLTAVEFID